MKDFINKGQMAFRYPKLGVYLLILAICLLSIASSAQQTITADDAVAIALQNNNTMKAATFHIQSAQALRPASGELPKLELNAQLGQYNSMHFDQAFQVSQNVPFPSLFGARSGKVNADIKRKEWDKAITENELTRQVRAYYCQVAYFQQNRTRLQYLDSLYGDFIRVAKIRFNTGDIKKIEISTAEARRGEIYLLLQQNDVYLGNAYQNLQLLLNVSDSLLVPVAEVYTPLQISNLTDTAAVALNPAIRALYQDAVVAEQSKKVERAQNLPDFTLGYTNQSLAGFQSIDGREQYFGTGKRFSYVNVGIAVPLTFGASRARVRSLDYKKQAAEAEALLKQQELMVQLQNTLNQYRQDMKQYHYYLQQALPNAKDIVHAAQVGYKAGDISYVEYLYALQTATDIELKYLQSIQQVNLSVINIQALINQ